MMRGLLKKNPTTAVRLPPLEDERGSPEEAGQQEPAGRPGDHDGFKPFQAMTKKGSFRIKSASLKKLDGGAPAAGSPLSAAGGRAASTRSTPSDNLGLAVDVQGTILFLQGKLKELTDMSGGPEELRVLRNQDAPSLVENLRKYLCGEDATSDIIRRGLALSDASRHRPDIAHIHPEEALLLMEDPSLKILQQFPVACEQVIVKTWIQEAAEFFHASVVINYLRYLERESKGSRETTTVVLLVEALLEAVRGVIVNRAATMEQEPAMVWSNMMAACTKLWSSKPESSDAQYRSFVVMSWCRDREGDILAIMEDNVEERMKNSGKTSLWGKLDPFNVRLRVCTPMWNMLDFIIDFLDYAYDAGYVFKPSARPPHQWACDDVVEWVLNLRLGQHVHAVRECGITGAVLLEMSKTDLEVVLQVVDMEHRKKLWMGLESLRLTSNYEMMPKYKRETRGLVKLTVPAGMHGGEKMVVSDPTGKSVDVFIPRLTADRVALMEAGMKFEHVFSYSRTVLNKWQLAGNLALSDAEPGCIGKGVPRTARNFWKGAIRKVKLMNKLESKINKVLRMSATDETVRLAAMNFFPKEAIVLRDFLMVNAVCKRLELSYNNFGPEGCTAVCQALMDNRTVTEVRFSSNKIGDRGAFEIARLIKTSHSLSEIDIGNNELSDVSGVALFQAASTSPEDRNALGQKIPGSHALKKLMVYNNNLGPLTFHAWAKSIKRNPALEVDLSENPGGDQGMASVSGYISRHWAHERLDLRAMEYGAEGCRLLAISLAENNFRVITKVFLSGNDLGLQGARHLALVLDKSISLMLLDVSGCNLGDDGVRVMCKSLQENMKLEYIDFGDNNISDAGVNHVATMLAIKGKMRAANPRMVPASLRRVVLSSNPITHEGFAMFATSVTSSCQSHVEAACCQIKDEGLRMFAVHLPNNKYLKVIDVSSNLLTADGLWVIADALKENESVETIRINDNRIGDSGGRAVAAILKHNHFIKEFNVAANAIGPLGVIPLCKVLAKRMKSIDVWLHGNPYVNDPKAVALVEKVQKRNRIVSIHS